MLHAREDYNRFQDPLNLIPEDEPVMLFRGQDKYVADLCRIYADKVENDLGDLKIVRAVRMQADRMDAWPVKKSPDMIKDIT